MPSGSQSNPSGLHLFIEMTAPLGPDEEVLLLSISTIHEGVPYDESCVLNAEEHEFIKHPSYIRYDKPYFLTVKQIQNGIRAQRLKPKSMVSESVYKRICAGLRTSLQVSPKARRFFEEDQAAI